MPDQAEHLTPWDFFCFLEREAEGHIDEELESHLTQCPECLETLDLILSADVPLMPEEEAFLEEIPSRSPEEIFERLKPLLIFSSDSFLKV